MVKSESTPPKIGVLRWAAEGVWRARIPMAIAFLVSFGLHSVIPIASQIAITPVEAVSIIEIIGAPPPPVPMPEAEVAVDAPPDDGIGAPKAGDKSDEAPPEKKAPDTPVKTPAVKTVPKSNDNALKTKKNEDLRDLAERLRRNRNKGKGTGTGSGGQGGTGDKKGGGATTPTRTVKGKPGSVYQCSKDGLAQEIKVRKSRRITDWVTIVPTVLSPFKTRASLRSYLPRIKQVVSRRTNKVRRLGPVEFALPAEPIRLYLDSPKGWTAVLGKIEGRCLVGVKYTSRLFPLELRGVPARLLNSSGRTVDAVVNIKLYKDASFSIRSTDGVRLPFSQGRLKNSKGIKKTIADHYAAADALKNVAGWFGIDVNKSIRDGRKNRAREDRRKNRKRRRR